MTLVTGAFLISACTHEFDTINSNPNFPEKVTPDLLMINILHKTATRMSVEGLEDGAGLSQHIGTWEFNEIQRYTFNGKASLWGDLYFLMRDVDNMTAFAEEAGNDAYTAVGMIMKAYLVSTLTDLWGDVPFYEANNAKSDRVFTSPYDRQEQIYTGDGGILDLLKNADGILASTTSTISASSDIYFKGNLLGWRKFANSLRLRYLLRIAAVYTNAAGEMQSIVTNNPLFNSNAEHASLPYLANAPNQFPLFTYRDGDFNYKRMTDAIEKIMEEHNDDRIGVWFQPASSPIGNDIYNGMPVGLLPQTRDAMGYSNMNHVSTVGVRLRSQPDGAEATLMNYSELQFILAEAAHKGLISGGVVAAQNFYEEGIKSSFEFWDVAMPANYLSQQPVAYNSATAMEQIITQKWLANFLVGYEGWIDFRRTGLPALPDPPDNANNGQVPSRFYYPNEEQLLNTLYWEDAVQRIGGSDDVNAYVWWEN